MTHSEMISETVLSVPKQDHSLTTPNSESTEIMDEPHLRDKIESLRKDIERKDSMLQNAALMGQRLVTENDELLLNLKDFEKNYKEKCDELHTAKKTQKNLEVTARRSADEADDFHNELVELRQITEQLKEENKLLRSINNYNNNNNNENNKQISPISSESIEVNNDIINQLEHENKTLQEFFKEEQEKCSQYANNAEINARKIVHAQIENSDLKNRINELEKEIDEISQQYQDEIEKMNHSLQDLESQNDSLQIQLLDAQQIMDNQAPTLPHNNLMIRPSSNSGGLCAELEDLGYIQNGRLLSLGESSMNGLVDDFNENDDQFKDEEEEEEDDHDQNEIFIKTPGKTKHKISVDAQEEFFRLTVIAAKIKFHDIPIATSTLWEKVKERKLSFHEVGDFLNDFLSKERAKREELKSRGSRISSNTRIKSITEEKNEASSPSKFFSKIKHLADSVTSFSTLRLEVRFGRRVFEVKMKKHDKLETLLQTLPRIIGEDSDSMTLWLGKIPLNPKFTLAESELYNNDILRMLPRNKVASYLRKYEKKIANHDISGIQMCGDDKSSVTSSKNNK